MCIFNYLFSFVIMWHPFINVWTHQALTAMLHVNHLNHCFSTSSILVFLTKAPLRKNLILVLSTHLNHVYLLHLFWSAFLCLGDWLWIIGADSRCRDWEHNDGGLWHSYLYGYVTCISCLYLLQHTMTHRWPEGERFGLNGLCCWSMPCLYYTGRSKIWSFLILVFSVYKQWP